MRVDEGKEELLMNACRNHFPAVLLREAFIFRYEKMMRLGGEWHVVEKPMFPGYIFLDTDRPEEFSAAVRQFEPVLKLLKNGQTVCEVTDEEEGFLKMLCGNSHLLKMSYGNIRKGHFIIESGPLRQHEALIAKIDRHKRSALLRIKIGGEERMIFAGLEIREKITALEAGQVLMNRA